MLLLMQVCSVWEQAARVGPLVVLPAPRSGPLPAQDLPHVLSNVLKPRLYGSQWRSGIGKKQRQQPSSAGGLTLTCSQLLDQKVPLPEEPTPDQETLEDASGEELKCKVEC